MFHSVTAATKTPSARRAVAIAAAMAAFSMTAVARAEFPVIMTNSGDATINGTNLQAELNAAAARSGETRIVLPAGASFTRTGGFTLPVKSSDNAYVTIESSLLSSMPSGKRVTPADASKMPKIVTPGSNAPAIRTAAGAHHFRLRGLEITSSTTVEINTLVALGAADSTQNAFSQVPHHIDIDRCYLHANDSTPTKQPFRRGIGLNSGLTTITNSYIQGFKHIEDAQAISGNNGTGPYFISNNYLEGSGENFMMGGAGTHLPNGTIPNDITFKRNHSSKPLSWRTVPRTWGIKNLFEIKYGKRFDIQGNLFENSWSDLQDTAIVIKVDGQRSSSNTEAENVTEDVYFYENLIRHCASGITLHGRSYEDGWNPTLDRVIVRNNLLEDISRAAYSDIAYTFTGNFIHSSSGGKNLTIEHNTCFNDRYALAFDGSGFPQTNFVYRNNVVQGPWNSGNDAVRDGGGSTRGTAALNMYAPSAIFVHNAILGANSTKFTGSHLTDNWFPTSWSGILVNQPSGNYNVVNPSVYYTNASPGDGKPIGADIALVNAQTAGASSGIWSASDIVLRPADAWVKTSNWTVVADAGAYDGAALKENDSGTPKVTDPLANPTSYFEMSFNAVANVPYRLWIRGKAPSNDLSSDSVHVQFTNTITASGTPAYRIGTGGAASANIYSIEWVLQDGAAAIGGWGWRDSTWNNGAVVEKPVIFATSGPQTIRVQRREDGPFIDEILLSPSNYRGGTPAYFNPGTETNDTTILAKSDVVAPGVLHAYDGFNYTGSLNTQNGGSGFGNAWTAAGATNPALASGSMAYSDGTNSLVTLGNKLQPALSSNSYRNFASAISASGTVWISFRGNQTAASMPTNHAGFHLFSSVGGTGSYIFLGKPGFSRTNWGIDINGTYNQKTGPVSAGDKDGFLVYKLVFSGGQATVSMWIDRALTGGEAALGSADLVVGPVSFPSNIASMNVSTGGNASGFQFDEFRFGSTLEQVAPIQ